MKMVGFLHDLRQKWLESGESEKNLALFWAHKISTKNFQKFIFNMARRI